MFFLDSSSTASSSTNNDPIKTSSSINNRKIKNHSNGLANNHKPTNRTYDEQLTSNISNDTKLKVSVDHQPTMSTHPQMINNHRSHPPVSGNNLLTKTVSNSIADLSLSTHNKMSSAAIRLPTFHSRIDNIHMESYKKIPLSQSFDWGMLAITNTDLILLYNKDKSSLVVYDANGHENEVKKLMNISFLFNQFYFFHYKYREFNGQMATLKISVFTMMIV